MRVTVSLADHENFMTCLFMKHKNVAGDNYFRFLDIFLQGYTLSVQMDITEGKKTRFDKNLPAVATVR